MPTRKIRYNRLPYQDAFQRSEKPNVYLSTGYGGGKTYSLVMKGFELMNVNAGLPGGLLCPNFKMYKRDVLPTIRQICSSNRIPYKYNKSDFLWFFPDTQSSLYVFHAEDDGASIRGPNLAFGLINEVTLVSKEAYDAFLARIRLKMARRLQIAMSGTPEGFNWNYEYFVEVPRADTDLIFGDARSNVHVASTYFKRLEDSYDPLMQEQYIAGKFVNLKGRRCAWAFDRFKHTRDDVEKIPGLPVLVSLDFNVAPMAATLWNRVPYGMDPRTGHALGSTLRAFDEICLESSDTYDLSEVLKEKTIGDHVVIYPDPAGGARSTKSKVTDLQILKLNGFENLRFKTQISVRDCLNALNNLLSKDHVVLNSKRCRQSIADLEQCSFKAGDSFEIDKSNSKRTHWLDGIKNMIDYEFPIKGRGSFREERIR
jgi:hypothetical protein